MQKTLVGNLNRQPNFPICGEMALNLKGFITIWESLSLIDKYLQKGQLLVLGLEL